MNFCRIVDAGSLTREAAGDPGKQSLYSRQIRELEEFFGVELKRRQGKGIIITDAGRRLAQLARSHLLALEDFQRNARQMPKSLSISAGNSVLEWALLPRMAALRTALPDTKLNFFSERTSVTVGKLVDMSIDIGLIREDALVPPLKSRRLISTEYALFVPRKMAKGMSAGSFKTRIREIPIATSAGGQFRETLEARAATSGWPLNIAVSCSSFTQAARAAKAGDCAAVLPNIAEGDFNAREVRKFRLPFLKDYSCPICLAWNPRLVEVRGFVQRALEFF